MSTSEILVSMFGLFLGYWIISKLISGKKVEPEKSEQTQEKDEFKHEYESKKSDFQAWYEVLCVSRTASMDEIQASYKSLIRQYHPDKVATLGEELRNLAEQKSKEINVAYKEAQDLRGRGS
jgi:DnaJ like chaperone protein